MRLIYPNKIYCEERTDAFGHADFELHARLPMTVLCGSRFRSMGLGDRLSALGRTARHARPAPGSVTLRRLELLPMT